MSNKGIKKGGILFAILLLPTIFFFILHSGVNNFNAPPIYGPKKLAEGSSIDTIYHTIPYFEFTNHLGEKVTQKDYDGKIYVADLFFATCPTICPKMATQKFM